VVAGQWRVSPGMTMGNIPEATAMMNVAQYYKIEANCSKPMLSIGPGGKAEFRVLVKNLGNDQDTIRVQMAEGGSQMSSAFYAVAFSQTDLIIEEKGDKTFNLSITAPKEISSEKTYALKLKIYSFQAEGLGEIPCEVFISLYLNADPDYEGTGDDDTGGNTTVNDDDGEDTPGFDASLILMALLTVFAAVIAIRKKKNNSGG